MTEQNLNLIDEVKRRRTFAIISHPDAGKTTLTEKFLLYGGAIREAGSVKSRRSQKHAVSDWMEIEKQRGISVTSSVMQFNYSGHCINILDTPGHQDFSEDTYRTLMAADSAVMVVDAAKGVEDQTRKLFHVCSLREMPIFTFINKMDREAQDPFQLLEDIESELGIKTYPMNWPIGSGKEFKGVYDRKNERIIAFNGGNHGATEVEAIEGSVDDERFREILGSALHDKLMEDIELLDIAGDEFDVEKVRTGELTPVFFGSALTNFGVEPFLENFLEMSNTPLCLTQHQFCGISYGCSSIGNSTSSIAILAFFAFAISLSSFQSLKLFYYTYKQINCFLKLSNTFFPRFNRVWQIIIIQYRIILNQSEIKAMILPFL